MQSTKTYGRVCTSSRRVACAALTATAFFLTACRERNPPEPLNVDLGTSNQPLLPTTLGALDPAINNARADDVVPLADLEPEPINDNADTAETDAAVADEADAQPQAVADFIAALRSADPAPGFVDQVVIYLLDAPDFTVDEAVGKALRDARGVLEDASLAADVRDRRLADILKNIGLPIEAAAGDDAR